MLGLLGILGCIIAATVVTAVVTVGCTVASIAVSCAQADAAEEAAARQEELQKKAMDKAENRNKATKATQERQITANLARTQMSVGSSIALEKVLTKRAKTKAAMKNAELKKEYSKGSPKVA